MSPTEFVRSRYALAFGYVRADVGVFALAVLATAMPQILADLYLDDRDALRIAALLGMVQLYVNLLVTFRTLDHAGAAPPGYQRADLTEARFPSAFLLSLVSTIGIAIGLLLLVLPGVLLFLLWSLALPALAAQRCRAIASMRASWRLGRRALGRLALIVVPFALVLLVAAIAIGAIIYSGVRSPVLPSAIANVTMSAGLAYMASVWTFAYLALRR